MLKIFYMHFFGYVNIEVEGFFIERFINLCFNQKIFLWRLERIGDTILKARISIKDFKKLPDIAKKTKCKFKVKNKKGLPFLLNKYRKRKIFAITLAVIAIFIFGLTRFVWNIEINCENGEINKAEIIELLGEEGIKEGSLVSRIDTEKAINKIMMKRDDISWMRNIC